MGELLAEISCQINEVVHTQPSDYRVSDPHMRKHEMELMSKKRKIEFQPELCHFFIRCFSLILFGHMFVLALHSCHTVKPKTVSWNDMEGHRTSQNHRKLFNIDEWEKRWLCFIVLLCWACTILFDVVWCCLISFNLIQCYSKLFEVVGCSMSFDVVVHQPRTRQTLGTCWMNGSAIWFDSWICAIKRTGKSSQMPTLN